MECLLAVALVTGTAFVGGAASAGAEENPIPRAATAKAARKALTQWRRIDTC
jgi:hypothetical protein